MKSLLVLLTLAPLLVLSADPVALPPPEARSEPAVERRSVTVGNPAEAAQLPAALQTAYADGARDITIAPGTYVIPATGRSAIALVGWKETRIRARGVTLVFEELAHRPFSLQRCEGVTVEGGILRFASPAFTQGRIVARGRDDRGEFLDWQIDAGYADTLDLVKSTFDVADAQSRTIKAGTGDIGFRESEPLGERRFRLRNPHGLLGPAAVGDWLITRIKPCEPVVHLDGCARCSFLKVILQNAGFAAFFETGGEGGHVYVECKVCPGPRPAGAVEDQLVGCGADGFHSSGVRNGPTLERCVWEGLLHGDGAIGNADITIADNRFDRNYGRTTIHVACSDGVRISGNRFLSSSLPLPDKPRVVLHLENSRSITLQGNTVENPSAQDTLVNLGQNVQAISGNDDSGLRVVSEK